MVARMRRGVPKKRVMDAKEMCKDRYVLICVSFSVLNAARPDKDGMGRRVSKEWTRRGDENRGMEESKVVKALRKIVTWEEYSKDVKGSL